MGIADLKNVSVIYELIKKGSRLEAEEEIMKYRELLLEQSEEILNLKKKVRELENKLNLKNKLEKTSEGFFVVEKDGTREGPYCIRCKEAEDKLLSLREVTFEHKTFLSCPDCNSSYEYTRTSSSEIGRS